MLGRRVVNPLGVLVIVTAIIGWGLITGGCSYRPKQPAATESKWLVSDATEADIQRAASQGLPAVVKLGSDSCAPCREMNAVMAQLAQEYNGKVLFFNVDVYKNPDLVKKYNVILIPKLVFIDKSGNAVGYVEGYHSVAQMKELITKSGIL